MWGRFNIFFFLIEQITFVNLSKYSLCYYFSISSTYFLSVFCLSCLLVFWNEDGQLLCYFLVKCVYKKKYGNTHLVTGDLLTLSGSSVTLKKKTKMVHVRNQLANRAAIYHLFLPPQQPITDVHRYTDVTFSQSTNITTENKRNWQQWWIW